MNKEGLNEDVRKRTPRSFSDTSHRMETVIPTYAYFIMLLFFVVKMVRGE